jgi:hypothetical protein
MHTFLKQWFGFQRNISHQTSFQINLHVPYYSLHQGLFAALLKSVIDTDAETKRSMQQSDA